MYYIYNCRVVVDHIPIQTYFIHSSNFPSRYAFKMAFMIGLTYSGLEGGARARLQAELENRWRE